MMDKYDIQDIARRIENLAIIMTVSAANGELNPEFYADVFELIGDMAASIREKAGCAA